MNDITITETIRGLRTHTVRCDCDELTVTDQVDGIRVTVTEDGERSCFFLTDAQARRVAEVLATIADREAATIQAGVKPSKLRLGDWLIDPEFCNHYEVEVVALGNLGFSPGGLRRTEVGWVARNGDAGTYSCVDLSVFTVRLPRPALDEQAP